MIQIDRLPAFNDNYLWGLYEGQSAWVVDPGDAEVVETWLTQKNLVLNGILLTHHHNDHTGGVEALVERNPMVEVIGSKQALRGVSAPVSDGDTIDLLSRRFQVMEVPGHTLDHVAFFSADPSPILFCGDTVFLGGCGRMFEGTPEQFQSSLARIAQLPPETMLYCAHEYTQANMEFACRMLPDNQAASERLTDVKSLRENNVPTVPDSLERELHCNPFFRLNDPSLMNQIGADESTSLPERFARVRQAKDNA